MKRSNRKLSMRLVEAREALEAASNDLAELQARARETRGGWRRGAQNCGYRAGGPARLARSARRSYADLAVVEALLAQAERVQEEAHDQSWLETRERVLNAAMSEAEAQRAQAAQSFLARLAAEVAELGRRFGVHNLESVAVRARRADEGDHRGRGE